MNESKTSKSSGVLQCYARSEIGEEASGVAYQFVDAAHQAVGRNLVFHQSPHPLNWIVLVCRVLGQPQHDHSWIGLEPLLD